MVAGLARAIHSLWPRGKPLKRVAELLNATDPANLQVLVEEMRSYNAEHRSQAMLSKYRGSPSIPVEAFLDLLHGEPSPSVRTRVELSELWLRSDPKPRGGNIRIGRD
jgi:hypothetical protein